MSNQRPTFIDLRSDSQATIPRSLHSPRHHIAGEVPPERSPLEALEYQTRLLAKQLEDSSRADKRVSRLPPLTTSSPLILQAQSDYFRSMRQDSGSENGETPLSGSTGLGLLTEIEDPAVRPVSMHPRMSRIPPTPDASIPLPLPKPEEQRGRSPGNLREDQGFFGARRDISPTSFDHMPSLGNQSNSSRSGTQDSTFSQSSQSVLSAGSPEKRKRPSNAFEAAGLVPPRPLFPKRSSSIMSSTLESTDEDGGNSLSNSFVSQASRKPSKTSGLISPAFRHTQRSESVSSDVSLSLPRPSFNFSRPLSRSGTPGLETPGLDTPARQGSSDSHGSFVLHDETVHTPVSMNSEGFPDMAAAEDGSSPAQTYIYSKFSLPRGKSLQRSTPLFPENGPQAVFSFEQPPIVPPSNVQTLPLRGHAPPSPPSRPSSSAGSRFIEELHPRPSMERSKLSIEESAAVAEPSALSSSRPSTGGAASLNEAPRSRPQLIEGSRSMDDVTRGRALGSPARPALRSRTPVSVSTGDSASTIKPTRSLHSVAPSASDTPADEHVTQAIALHEQGSLKESTYHLRHAARQGHPTGMLLYALACRHGWGMRPNQREGVQWLRKAADCAQLEIADDEDQVKEGKTVDPVDRKTRKAQFALSVYELGVSHMNGWGIEQDRALALRCFEIAGSWGDVDALAEAGFCYAKGIGCKKDLKKSAKFYREAEAKGMSMVGNSW
jgi:TPR repeat protein